MNCLGIPIPGCVRDLLREPPVCFPIAEDAQILDRIQGFGTGLGRPPAQIKQACNLASGLSDLVIILERPAQKHQYEVPFDQFVRDSPTLKAVDELIRFASKGARSIHTVTVLDAFSFSPRGNGTTNDAACHQLIEGILNLKRPRVVLCCWRGSCDNPVVSEFRSLFLGEGTHRDREVDMGTWSTIRVRSFHPSRVVNYRTRSPYMRMLLIYHFVSAFALLGPYYVEPPWVQKISGQARNESKHGDPETQGTEATILHLLRRMTRNEAIQEQDEVRHRLRRLFSSNYTRGAADVACLCLNWQNDDHRGNDVDVLNQLYELGSRQASFLPESGYPDVPLPIPLEFDDA